jgi:tetratricopeptide (TPR) repeat protein
MIAPLRLASLALAALLLAACGRQQAGQPQSPPTQTATSPDPGAAQPAVSEDESMAQCADMGVRRIDACTAVVESSAASPRDRAIALNNRGVMRSQQGDKDGAIADYTAAIAINPQYDAAFYNRALAWRDKGETAKADADSAEAVRINPALKGR